MFDLIIVGSGISAYSLLYHLPKHLNVAVVFDHKKNASRMAQGGISTSLFEKNKKSHVKDTYLAGCEYGDKKVIKKLISAGNAVIEQMIEDGMTFDTKNGKIDFGLEGAHSIPRILHKNDQTGKHVMRWLYDELKPNITCIQGDFIDYLYDKKLEGVKIHSDGKILELKASNVVMATGGYSGLYHPASKPMTGSVVPLLKAFDLGLSLVDLEMVQFHPTMFVLNDQVHCLVSEAVRGAGGVLVTADGQPIMKDIPQQDLAPRHVVSRELFRYISDGTPIFLDISSIKKFDKEFPFIHQKIVQEGIDHLIPVSPGAHYTMGGVKTKIDGSTAIDGLFFIGESACTGFHGANRLASNSLLEGLAMGKLASETILGSKFRFMKSDEYSGVYKKDTTFDKKAFMKAVGITREKSQMQSYLDSIAQETSDEARFAALVTEAALRRPATLGAHIRKDSTGAPDYKKHYMTKKGDTIEYHTSK